MTNITGRDEILFVVVAIIGLFLRREQTADKPAGNAAGDDDDMIMTVMLMLNMIVRTRM